MAGFKRKNEEDENFRIIAINNKYRLKIVKYNLILQILKEVTSRETGGTSLSWQDDSYFSSMEPALKRMIELEIQTAASLEDILNKIKEAKKIITPILNAPL